MRASSVATYFGNRVEPPGAFDVRLPRYLEGRSNICMFTISSLGRGDWSSWYELWEGAQAVLGMCLRFGREGTAIMR
ncbi:MAG: hypothetical protein Q9183_006108, partial [Haloplaca sp. 2 TL-2023]